MGGLLTDLESVRQFLQERAQIEAQDDDIEELILQVSDAIPRYCLREFVPSYGVTRSFELMPTQGAHWPWPSRAERVNFVRYEARSISKIVLDPDIEGGVELPPEEWRLYPYPGSREGTYYGLRLAETIPAPLKPLIFPTRRIDVTGDWGMESIPELVRRYANQTVADWLELPKDGREFNETMPEGEAPAPADDLPASVRKGLARTFMRPQFPR